VALGAALAQPLAALAASRHRRKPCCCAGRDSNLGEEELRGLVKW
jgi:hypothetical protein